MERRKNDNGNVKIRISGLSQGIHEYDFSVEPSVLGLDENYRQVVDIDARLEKTSRQLYLQTEIRSSGHFQCDRCLDEFEQPVMTRYSMFYIYDELENGKYLPEEVQVITPDTAYIDLAGDVRQMIILSVPLKLLCREECRGLCPQCGINWNHRTCTCKVEVSDSRWNSLERLLDR